MQPACPFPLDAASIEEVARRVVELLGERSLSNDPAFVNAAEVARRFAVDRSWVYAHAAQLGAIRLGEGPRARLRFDLRVVAEALAAPPAPQRVPAPARVRRRRSPARHALLPVNSSR